MATVTLVTAQGRTQYRFQVRVKRKQDVGANWAKHLEVALQDPAYLAKLTITGSPILGELITRYLALLDEVRGEKVGRSLKATLTMLRDSWPIGKRPVSELTSQDFIDHARARYAAGAGAATINQDLALLRGPLGAAKPAFGIDVSTRPIEEARPFLVLHGRVARPKERDRRPTMEEIKALMAYFREQDERSIIPMAELYEFALWTGMREGAICSIRWEDLDDNKRTQKIRDAKHPRKKWGNDIVIPLLGDAYQIIKRQPRIDERIFPYTPDSVSARFSRFQNHLISVYVVDLCKSLKTRIEPGSIC